MHLPEPVLTPPRPAPADHSGILESVSQLTQLQSLYLHISCRAPEQPLADIPARHLRSFSHLSSLTALTHLHLKSNPCSMLLNAEQLVWDQLWAAQREALAAALRHMPHLTSFNCSTRPFRVSDLAALTSLKRAYIRGLTHPAPTGQQQPAAPGPGTSMRGPHQLRELTVGAGACSLRALACLGAFPLLQEATSGGMSTDFWFFTPADVSPGGTQLLPDTPHMVRQAVKTLADVWARAGDNGGGRRPGTEPRGLCITSHVDPLLLPPAPAPFPASPTGGHAAWLRELGPLRVPGQGVRLWGLALAAGDLAAIADTFPDAKVRSVSCLSPRAAITNAICFCSTLSPPHHHIWLATPSPQHELLSSLCLRIL